VTTDGLAGATNGGAGHLSLAFIANPASVHTRRWLTFFLARGHDVSLLFDERVTYTGNLHPAIRVLPFKTLGRHLGRWGVPGARAALQSAVAAARPDVLHAHYVTWYAFAAWLSGFHPYVVTPWGSDLMVTIPTSRRRRMMGRIALHSADLVTCGSRHLIDVAVAAGARRERTRFIHFGVDTARFTPGTEPVALRAKLDLGGRRVLLANRAIQSHYRPLVIVEALVQLPADVVVLMTRHNPDMAEFEAVQRRARDLGLADRVRFLPELSDAEMPDLYRLADVVVSIPLTDGGPLTLVEALAAGRPIVATDVSAVREWLEDLDPAVLVPVDDIDATADAIRSVLARDPAERADRARRGRAAVLERGDFQRNMEAMESLYLELARRH
jgi:L-malate glycosyltransferase